MSGKEKEEEVINMGRNIYSQYSTHLHNLMFKVSYIGLYNMYSEIKNKYEEDRKNKVPYDELWYAKALKYVVETYHIDLLDICKFVFDIFTIYSCPETTLT